MKKEKKKFKAIIMSYVLAFVCITSWVALGVVLALTSANISVNGNISFTANDVYADVTGTVTGTATTNTLEDIHLTADTTSFTTPSSWSNIAFDFVKGQDIVFTINVNNKSTENSILVTFADNISATNTTITRKSAGTTVNNFNQGLLVPKSTTKSVEITMSVKDKNVSASGNFDLGLNLSTLSLANAKDASEYPTLSFTANETLGTASVGCGFDDRPTGALVIPSSVIIDGQEYAVTCIKDSAFMENSSITSVTIPSSVIRIESQAFVGCPNLTSVTISAGVTYIGNEAFCSCSSLTSITIPESVTRISPHAFGYCSALTSVTFENTTGWKVFDAMTDEETALNSSDLTDKSKAATFLTNTYSDNCNWTRS